MKKLKKLVAGLLTLALVTASIGFTYGQSVEDYTLLSSNFNPDAVQNGPTKKASFSSTNYLHLKAVTVYHWNGGQGATPGTISIYDAGSDAVVGTFLAEGRLNNTYWDCYPDVILAPGSYYIKDSGWDTASWNSGAPGGMMELRGTWYEDDPSADVPQSNKNTTQNSNSSNNSSSSKSSNSQKYYFSTWAKSDIERAMKLNIIPESLNGDDLSEGISRQQFAAVAVKAYEKMSGNSLSAGSNPFNDTSDSYVLKAANGGIVAGTSATTFSPNSGLTREQAATMLTRAYKKTVFSGWSLQNDYALEYSSGDSFDDFYEIRPYARESVGYLAAKGVISGVGNNRFAPENTLTKEQAIAIAVRMIDKLDTSPQNGKKVEPPVEETTSATKDPVSPNGQLKSGDIITWGTGTITYTEKPVNKTPLSGGDLSKYNKGSAKAIAGFSYSNEDGDHLLLDHKERVSFDVSSLSREDRDYLYAISVEPDGSYTMMSPDPAQLDNGQYTYETCHFSDQVLMSEADKKTLDEWVKKASYLTTMEGVNNVSLEKSIQESLQDTMKEWGLGKGQVAGELARYIVSHAGAGDIINAAVDGDTDELKKKLANSAGEYLLGKLIKSETYKDIITGEELSDDAEFLRKSMGDNADAISKGIAEGDMSNQLVEIIKNVEKNLFPYVDEVEKFGKLCGVMKKIWQDDTINWYYEKNYKACIEGGSALSYDEFSTSAAKLLHGAGISIDTRDLYEQFQLRYQNEQKVKQTETDMRKFFTKCNEDGINLFSYDKWYKLGSNNTFENRLQRLWNIRNAIKEIVTINGKLSKGEYRLFSDEDFLAYLASEWVSAKNAGNMGLFYQHLVDEKVLTLKQAQKYSDTVKDPSQKDTEVSSEGCNCAGNINGKCMCDNCSNPFCNCRPISIEHSVSNVDTSDVVINTDGIQE
ncbi:MAG: S-layer homology domain-containing protein [Firmicutes bacterium]|nr:S-layer homology domain-containing protein [Bacillota bacterium]